MPAEIRENKSVGSLYPTERVHIAAALVAYGHRVHKYTLNPKNKRLVIWFPATETDGKTVEETIRKYINHELVVDAKRLIDAWMDFRDMTRNKEKEILGSGPPETL